MRLVTAAEMRELDQRTIALGTPGHVLMERAGMGACEVLRRTIPAARRRGARIVVLAGKGNNGGDGFVMARALRRRGAAVEVFLFGRAAAVGGDARRNLDAWKRAGGAVREVVDDAAVAALRPRLSKAACVIDALLGTGLQADVTGTYAAAVELMNACGVPVFAVDIPSGLDADTGRPRGIAVRAAATATFGFAKYGQVLHPGVAYCGALEVVDIGLDPHAIEAAPRRGELMSAAAAAALLPRRSIDAHKGQAGHLLVMAGSAGMSGAAILAARAATRGGAGLVTLATPASIQGVCAGAVLESMTIGWPERNGSLRHDPDLLAAALQGKTAVAIGPGLGSTRAVRDIVRWLLHNAAVPLVLDADALNALARNPAPLRRAARGVVLTPHPGEMARLLGSSAGDVQADRVGAAQGFAAKYGCTVVLKGARTVIADRQQVWINPTGNPGLASGGTGDVLAGLTGALLAQGLECAAAARLGAYLHGLAGDLAVAATGEIGMVASDVIAALPAAIRRCGEHGGE